MTGPSGPAIELRGVHFNYGGPPVLRDLSLGIKEGAFTGVIGPNGSGKSTLVSLIAGWYTPTEGEVRLLGRSVRAWPRRALACKLAVIPQMTTVAFPFTALEVVLMGRSPHRGRLSLDRAEDLEVARGALAMTDALEAASRPIDELSGGERQRVILARALAQEPEVLVLDEPTTALDIRHQVAIFRLLRTLKAERGVTVVVVVHDLNLAARYCERLILLSHGQCVVEGTPEKVLTEATLSGVYETPVAVRWDETTRSPLVLPL